MTIDVWIRGCFHLVAAAFLDAPEGHGLALVDPECCIPTSRRFLAPFVYSQRPADLVAILPDHLDLELRCQMADLLTEPREGHVPLLAVHTALGVQAVRLKCSELKAMARWSIH